MASKPLYSASVATRFLADGTPTFDVRYRELGDSRRLNFASLDKAEKWANIVRAIGPTEAVAMLSIAANGTSPTVDDYALKFINGKSGIEDRSKDEYRRYMRLHISPAFGHLPIDAISKDTVAALINQKAAAGSSGKTIKNWHGFLSGMFESAVEDELINRNPCARSKLPTTEQIEMTFLSANEFASLLSYVPAHFQPLIATLAGTGLRWGEATALRPSDIDVEARTVRVARAWKWSKVKKFYIGPPKTKRSRRTIPIPDDLVAMLTPLLETKNEYLFATSRNNPVRQSTFFTQVWEPARRMANGLPAFEVSRLDKTKPWAAKRGGVWTLRKPALKAMGKTPRIHDLRHSHASWLLAAGIGIDVVSRRLGHESVKTTMDVYGHVAVERMNEAGDVIGIILAGALPQLTT